MRRLLKLSVSQYLLLGTQLVTGPLIARALGPEDRGLLSTVLVVYLITAIVVGLGSQAGFRRLVTLRVKPEVAYCYLNRWFLISSSVSFAAAAAVLYSLNSTGVAFAIAGLIATSSLANYRNAVVAGAVALGELNLVSRNSILNGLVTLLGITGLFFVGQLNFYTAIAVYGSATILASAQALRRLSWQPSDTTTGPSFRYSLASIPGQLGETALVRVDQLLVPLLLSFQAAGYYAVAFSYAYMIYPLLHSLSIQAASGIRFGEVKSSGAGVKLARISIIGLAVAVVAALSSRFVITTLFGPEYEPSVLISLVLLMSVAMMGISVFLIQLNHASGSAQRNSLSSLVGASITVSASIIVAPTIGMLGIAVSSACGVGSHLLIQAFYFARHRVD